jgi:hypothetical protein
MSLVRVKCPPGPGGRLSSSQIEPGSAANRTCAVIMVLSVEERMCTDFLIILYITDYCTEQQSVPGMML